MARLKTLRPRVGVIDTRRVTPLRTESQRIAGYARQNLKRLIYTRDGGRCRLCGCVVEIIDSELDHRIALQFGGSNDPANLWTLCKPCHVAKSAREIASQAPDVEALAADTAADTAADAQDVENARFFIV